MIDWVSLAIGLSSFINVILTLFIVKKLVSYQIPDLSGIETDIAGLKTFVQSFVDEEELDDQEKTAQAEEQLEALVSRFGDEMQGRIETVIENRFKSANMKLGKQEKALNKDIFEDMLDNHPQGALIKLGIDSGLIGGNVLKRLYADPTYLILVLQKFGPQLEKMQSTFFGQTNQSTNNQTQGKMPWE